jgi:cell wall-associated NlpC family hydrolase
MIRSRARQAPAILLAITALAAVILAVASSASANPIEDKQAEAQAILDQVRAMDSQLAKAIESYNYANVQLAQLDDELTSNARHLQVARGSLLVAQEHIAKRLRALYINGDGGGTVEVILGAESLDDLLNRLDVVQTVGGQDAAVLKDVKVFRREVVERRARLRTARATQARVVSERAEQKQSIERQLAERERLLASVQDQIAELQAQERRRQAQAAAAARARLAAQIAAQQRANQSQIQLSELEPQSPAFGGQAAPEVTYDVPAAQYGGVVGIAMQYLGIPYVWGGASPSGFDCSGFTQYVFNQVGVSLPHHAASQFGYGTPVSRDQLEAGDLVFFDGLGHNGIYIGGGQFIHSPHTGDVVKISSIYDSWYSSTWVGGRRL